MFANGLDKSSIGLHSGFLSSYKVAKATPFLISQIGRFGGGVPFLVIGNVRTGQIDFGGCRYVPMEYFEALDWIKKPSVNDILYTVVGSYGIPVLINDEKPFCVQRHIAIFKSSKSINQNFITYLLQSKLVFDQASDFATGIAQKTVPLSGLRKFLIPLPPLEEQQAIVEKVNTLMALCDLLEQEIQNSKTTQEDWMKSSLREVFAGKKQYSISNVEAIMAAEKQEEYIKS